MAFHVQENELKIKFPSNTDHVPIGTKLLAPLDKSLIHTKEGV